MIDDIKCPSCGCKTSMGALKYRRRERQALKGMAISFVTGLTFWLTGFFFDMRLAYVGWYCMLVMGALFVYACFNDVDWESSGGRY